jgi:anti-sigma B factor antagonist
MHLEIQQREREGIVVLDLKGRLVAGEEAGLFRDAVERVSQTDVKIILNLHAVDYIDSLGLGTMVMLYTRLRKVGGVAKLAQLNRRNLELLLLTKIDTIFEVLRRRDRSRQQLLPRS